MLTHIVLWKYKPEISEEERERHRQRLRDLKDLIAEVVTLHVGADMLHLSRSYDTGLVVTFRDRDALEIYTNDARHQAVVAIGREIAEHVVSVDFID